ncbi:MAG TPA: ABC transporter substrate-binding protein [Candidatus Dormibacteraeota bacterium]|nr:ABC transporter substrate-binding protein [Candidatus Dormibacteraeota bacterium]
MTRRLGILLLALLAAAACAEFGPSHGNQLVLGAIYPLSGPQAEGGKEELAGVQSALRVSHANVRLQVIDATTPQAAAAAVDSLVRDYHVPAIVGTYGSTLSAAASTRAEQLKTVYWETGAVADPITAHRQFVFRTVATGSALGRMAATFSHDVLIPQYGLASPRAVIVRVNDIYGESVAGGEQELAQSMGVVVVDVIGYNQNAYDPAVIAAQVAADHPDFLWDVSYLDDGVAIWNAVLNRHVPLKGAIGTSSAFCMPEFSHRVGTGSIGVYAADKPDATISPSALSASGRDLLARARAAYGPDHMDIPAVAGFVGGWTLFHDVIPNVSGSVTADSIRQAALGVDVPVGDSINGGGVKFAGPGAPDEGQNIRAAAVVGQWQAVGVMKVLYPAAYATGQPMTWSYEGM